MTGSARHWDNDGVTERDRPWVIRTYSGHSSARASNELYRSNLAKGQTGLSVAFDLPTQTGYDADHPLARGEVGKVGVPVPHLGEMRTLFEGMPLEDMNTSMTINATAMWLIALYIALAEERGVDPTVLAGHDAERHREGVPLAGHVHLRPRAEPAAHRRRHHPHGQAPPALEPDQRLPVPPAGSGRDSGPGAGVRPRHRGGRARRGARLGPGEPGGVPRGRRTDLVLHRRRHPVRRGDVQDARVHARCGTASASSATACRTRSCAGSATACR